MRDRVGIRGAVIALTEAPAGVGVRGESGTARLTASGAGADWSGVNSRGNIGEFGEQVLQRPYGGVEYGLREQRRFSLPCRRTPVLSVAPGSTSVSRRGSATLGRTSPDDATDGPGPKVCRSRGRSAVGQVRPLCLRLRMNRHLINPADQHGRWAPVMCRFMSSVEGVVR